MAVCLITASSAYAQTSNPCDVDLRTERVAINNEAINKNDFTKDRQLSVYSAMLAFEKTEMLMDMVNRLSPGSVWVDMGAGEAQALVDGLRINSKILGVGISYKKPELFWRQQELEQSGRLKYLDGDFVENMYMDGKLNEWMGKVDIITDVFGPMSYSENLPLLMQTYFDLLKPGGTLNFNFATYKKTWLFSTRSFVVAPYNSFYKNGIEQVGALMEWLKTIPGIEIVESLTAEYSKNYSRDSQGAVVLKIKKTSEQVSVPNTIKIKSYEATVPPTRTYELVD